ncbi:hypothetical protein ANN_24524 [Periplaneta americana]|uniref:Uncharacterized protein n=1 Tax=Periplaneta americana TaxID=6978 RepID=A0ABQ8S3B6_PERAM|nr:hypothetical protein ANN_24524 [Periplaneta americana]
MSDRARGRRNADWTTCGVNCNTMGRTYKPDPHGKRYKKVDKNVIQAAAKDVEANSTHLTQPLDVAFFRPLKMAWRKVLTNWKAGVGRRESTIPKPMFPHLLTSVIETIEGNEKKNIISGFTKCGIIPLNNTDNAFLNAVDDSILEILKSLRYDNAPKQRQSKKKLKDLTDFDYQQVIGKLPLPLSERRGIFTFSVNSKE